MTSDFAAGNYRTIPAVFQYSGGCVGDARLCHSSASASAARFHWPKASPASSQIIWARRAGR